MIVLLYLLYAIIERLDKEALLDNEIEEEGEQSDDDEVTVPEDEEYFFQHLKI